MALVQAFVGERSAGERFDQWLARRGGPRGVDDLISHLDRFDTEEYFVDDDETGPFSVPVGDSERM